MRGGLVTCVPGDEDGTSAFYMSPAFFLHDTLNDEFLPQSGARRASPLKAPPESFFFMPGAKNCCHCGSTRREGDAVVTGPFSLLNVSDSFFCAKNKRGRSKEICSLEFGATSRVSRVQRRQRGKRVTRV